MLTGVEIVGIVLGVLPITIEAFDRGKSIWKTNKEFASRRRPVEKLLRALRFQAILLEDRLRNALFSVGVDGSADFDALVIELQQDENVDLLEQFMGKSVYYSYCVEVENCADILARITQKVEGLLPPGADVKDLRTVLETNKGRRWKFDIGMSFKFLLQKSEIEELTAELKESSDNIKDLFEAAAFKNVSGTTPASNKTRKLAAALQRVRDDADALYAAVRQCWTQSCHDCHQLKLYLEDRFEVWDASSQATGFRSTVKPIVFRAILTSTTGHRIAASAPENHFWHETDIRVLDDEYISSKSNPSAAQADAAPNNIKLSGGLHTARHSVAFKVVLRPPPSAPATPTQKPAPIKDLCQSIQRAKCDQKKLRLCLQNQGKLHGDHCDITTTTVQNLSANTISLASLLSTISSTRDRSQKLDMRYRIVLALRLASSLLQLLATPWLGSTWNAGAIGFLVKQGSTAVLTSPQNITITQIDIENPVITQDFATCLSVDTSRMQEADTIRRVFLELGIMMLEIYHETPLETYFAKEFPVFQDEYTFRQFLAKKWIEKSKFEIVQDYLMPIMQCVECSFEPRTYFPDWKNGTFRKSVCEAVIEPLINLCGQWRKQNII